METEYYDPVFRIIDLSSIEFLEITEELYQGKISYKLWCHFKSGKQRLVFISEEYKRAVRMLERVSKDFETLTSKKLTHL